MGSQERSAANRQEFDVAALFVDPKGVYANLPGVDVWGEERDARLYEGPWPVVAHPPCRSWSIMGQCRPEIIRGEDGGDEGCFEAALQAVRRFGGVLEHPARSRAWRYFDLPRPRHGGWYGKLFDGGEGWACEVDQRWYGHEARKPTWLYIVGVGIPGELRWGRGPLSDKTVGRSWGQGRSQQRAATPPAFRDVLLSMARSARVEVSA